MKFDIQSLNEALENEEIAVRQVEFAIRLLTYCEQKKIDPKEFDKNDHIVLLEQGNLRLPQGKFDATDKIIRAANISVLLAFAGSAFTLDEACKAAGIKPCPKSKCRSKKLCALVYMIRCAFAHAIGAPKWEVRGNFKRKMTFELDAEKITIDLAKLHGTHFDFPQIGGHHVWFQIRNYLVSELREMAND